MADLHRRPAELEYTDWDSKIEYHQSQLSGRSAREAGVPKEEERNSNKDGTNQMPCFSSAVSGTSLVAEVSNDGRGCGISNLTNEEEKACVSVVQSDDKVEKDEKIGKPHTGTHVVEDVPHAIRYLANEG